MLPVEGVYEHGCFMTLELNAQDEFPNEVFFSNIRAIRVMRHRDRHGSGNVLGRIALPNSARSRAALPARRDSFTVPSNGSTGAAHLTLHDHEQLSLGVWGSFSTPHSRALGGKSGMTRAASLVFVLPRRADLRVPHLSFGLACLAFCIAWATTPPPNRPHLLTFTQDQPCLDEP